MTAFEPDGVFAGIPYRVLPDASIEAMLPGGLIKFKNLDQLLATVDCTPVISIVTHTILPHDALKYLDNRNGNVPALRRPPEQAMVYELERLKRDADSVYSSMSMTDLARHINEIALAVARIEASATDDRRSLSYQQKRGQVDTDRSLSSSVVDDRSSPPEREQTEIFETTHSSSSNALQILPPRSNPPLYPGLHPIQRLEEFRDGPGPEEVVLYARGRNLLMGILLVGMAFIGTAVVAGTLWHFFRVSPSIEVANNALKTNEGAVKPSSSIDSSSKLEFPVPTSYGIYALSDNRLIELETLPITVPDARVALSAELKKPSTTTISNDKPAFILFRRDLLNNAPQKMTLRVVARMERETKFIDGKPVVTKIDQAWRIRNKSYDLKVSPIAGHREMVIARPEDTVSLPAGRYALVLNRVGYDFNVKGPITSSAQCLERFETANGSVFLECRSP